MLFQLGSLNNQSFLKDSFKISKHLRQVIYIVVISAPLVLTDTELNPQRAEGPHYPSLGIRLAQCCNAILSRVLQLDYFPSHSTLLGLHNLHEIPPWDTSIEFSFDASKLREVIIEFIRSSECLDAQLLIWNWKSSSYIKAQNAPAEYHLWNDNHAELFHKLRYVWKDADPLMGPFVNLYSIARQAGDADLRWTVIPYEKSQQTKFASDLPKSLFFPTVPCSLVEFGRTRCPPDIELYLKAMFGASWRIPWRTWDEDLESYVPVVSLETTDQSSTFAVLTSKYVILLIMIGSISMTYFYRRRGTIKNE